jgi:hypothetical protein
VLQEATWLYTERASRIARAWLAAQAAADNSTDKGTIARPSLFRTTLIEQFTDGLRFTATDSYWTACAWVGHPTDPDDDDCTTYHPAPEAGEAPRRSLPVVDHEYRIRDLLAYIVRRTAKVDAEHPDTRLAIRVEDGRSPDVPTLDPLFDRQLVLVEIPDVETVAGYMNELGYPNVARIHDEHRPENAGHLDHVQLNPDLLRKLARSCSAVGAAGLRFAFHGDPTKPLSWQVVQPASALLWGLVMPQRSDIDIAGNEIPPDVTPDVAAAMRDFVDSIDEGTTLTVTAGGKSATVTGRSNPKRSRT